MPSPSVPTIACTANGCGGQMVHMSGPAFRCALCGTEWAPHATLMKILDHAITETGEERPFLAKMIAEAAVNDNKTALYDLETLLQLPFYLHRRIVLAWAAQYLPEEAK